MLPESPTTLPASDVPIWAKAENKPVYDKSEIGLGNLTDNIQIKGLTTGTTDGQIMAFGIDGYSFNDTGKTVNDFLGVDDIAVAAGKINLNDNSDLYTVIDIGWYNGNNLTLLNFPEGISKYAILQVSSIAYHYNMYSQILYNRDGRMFIRGCSYSVWSA